MVVILCACRFKALHESLSKDKKESRGGEIMDEPFANLEEEDLFF